MANISSYNQLSSWNEDDDLLFVQQPDAPKKASPAQVKQYVEAGDFEATGEVKDGHGNILADMAKSADVNTALGNKQNVIDQVNFVDSSISWPSSGTDAEKVLSIATQVLNNLSATKAFSMISIKDSNTLLGEMIYGRVTSSGYGKGIFMSYYINGIYRVKNTDGTVTVARLAEV